MKEKKGGNKRLLLGSILVAILIGLTLWLVLNWDEASQQKATVRYADGCVETFINGELVTDECVKGRELDRLAKERRVQKWNIPNLTVG